MQNVDFNEYFFPTFIKQVHEAGRCKKPHDENNVVLMKF